MTINQLSCGLQGRFLIERFEGLRTTAYQNMFGVWTIGYGHIGPDVKSGMTITGKQAEEILIKDLTPISEGVNAMVAVRINQNQFDALVSFAYNQGQDVLEESTMLELLNGGDFQAAAEQFSNFASFYGKKTAGLLQRRNAERDLFLTPI
jgi:lysozyme